MSLQRKSPWRKYLTSKEVRVFLCREKELGQDACRIASHRKIHISEGDPKYSSLFRFHQEREHSHERWHLTAFLQLCWCWLTWLCAGAMLVFCCSELGSVPPEVSAVVKCYRPFTSCLKKEIWSPSSVFTTKLSGIFLSAQIIFLLCRGMQNICFL